MRPWTYKEDTSAISEIVFKWGHPVILAGWVRGHCVAPGTEETPRDLTSRWRQRKVSPLE